MSLTLVNSLFLNEEHARLDEEILGYNPVEPSNISSAASLLSVIAQLSEHTLAEKCTTVAGARDLLTENPGLHAKLIEAWNAKSFKDVRNLDILQAPLPQVTTPIGGNDEEAAGSRRVLPQEYAGDAADCLWNYITRNFDPESSVTNVDYSPVVQSWGAGRSRTVDRLGGERFVVPVGLLRSGATGFPPADHAARDFLTGGTTPVEAYRRACPFLHALFRYTNELLQELSLRHHGSAVGVAQQFRELMTAGQEMDGHNQFRQRFYHAVVRHAEKLRLEKPEIDPLDACKQLVETLRASHGQKPPPTDNASEDKFPLVLVAFDEAQTLIGTHAEDGRGAWSHLGELQAVLRSLRELPLFALFVSTTSEIGQAMSGGRDD